MRKFTLSTVLFGLIFVLGTTGCDNLKVKNNDNEHEDSVSCFIYSTSNNSQTVFTVDALDLWDSGSFEKDNVNDKHVTILIDDDSAIIKKVYDDNKDVKVFHVSSIIE